MRSGLHGASMAIRKRITFNDPVRNTTGLDVLNMLTAYGVERTLGQKIICLHIHKIWQLNYPPSKIEAAQVDFNRDDLIIMLGNGDLHRFDISEVMP